MDLICRHCTARFRAAIQLPLASAVRVICPSCRARMVLRPTAGVKVAPHPAGGTPSFSPAGVGGGAKGPAPEGIAGAASGVATPVRPQHSGAFIPPARPVQQTAPRVAPAEAPSAPVVPRVYTRRVAVVADDARPFRAFLGKQLERLGFEVSFFDSGDPTLDFVRRSRAHLVIVNVYLKGKLGVEVAEEIKADPQLQTKVILIGALFRANRFRANPTNLYGADEYIEELIPQKEFRQVIERLFPEVGRAGAEPAVEPPEYDEARRLARLILSDIVIYHSGKVERGIREDNFFEVLKDEIDEGRHYFESRVPPRVGKETPIFSETLEQFVQMKREELEKLRI